VCLKKKLLVSQVAPGWGYLGGLLGTQREFIVCPKLHVYGGYLGQFSDLKKTVTTQGTLHLLQTQNTVDKHLRCKPEINTDTITK